MKTTLMIEHLLSIMHVPRAKSMLHNPVLLDNQLKLFALEYRVHGTILCLAMIISPLDLNKKICIVKHYANTGARFHITNKTLLVFVSITI